MSLKKNSIKEDKEVCRMINHKTLIIFPAILKFKKMKHLKGYSQNRNLVHF